ncbi:MAG TPA: hypothetical protein VGO59_03495 [Verrucomicrobiae bacterium]
MRRHQWQSNYDREAVWAKRLELFSRSDPHLTSRVNRRLEILAPNNLSVAAHSNSQIHAIDHMLLLAKNLMHFSSHAKFMGRFFG